MILAGHFGNTLGPAAHGRGDQMAAAASASDIPDCSPPRARTAAAASPYRSSRWSACGLQLLRGGVDGGGLGNDPTTGPVRRWTSTNQSARTAMRASKSAASAVRFRISSRTFDGEWGPDAAESSTADSSAALFPTEL